MIFLLKKTVLAAALAATALAGSAPAMADGYRGGYHHDEDGAGLAIGAGIVGLALGAIIVSNAHHRDRFDGRNGGYYADGGYNGTTYAQPYWTWHDGYYWDREGNRYDRSYSRDERGYDRRGYRDGYAGGGYGGGYRGHGYEQDGDRNEQRYYDGGRGY